MTHGFRKAARFVGGVVGVHDRNGGDERVLFCDKKSRRDAWGTDPRSVKAMNAVRYLVGVVLLLAR